MNYKALTVLNTFVQTLNTNINHIKDIAIFMAIGVIVSIAYVLISNMLDTTIKSEEDIEKNLKLTVLTTIPLYSQDDKGGRR